MQREAGMQEDWGVKTILLALSGRRGVIILAGLVVVWLGVSGALLCEPSFCAAGNTGQGLNSAEYSLTDMKLNQSTGDSMPPGGVRNLGLVPDLHRNYSRGFFIPAYFPLDGTATEILNDKFDLVIIGRDSDYSGVNPDVITLVTGQPIIYSNSMGSEDEWNLIDLNEDWFLHSSSEMSPETRVPLSGYPHLFYMNVGSEGWRNFVVSKYIEVVSENPAAAGVFIDGVPIPAEYELQVRGAFPDYDGSAYQWMALDLIRAIKNSVTGRLVILNSELHKPFTLEADGALAEGFVHFGGSRNDEHISKTQWLSNIETIGDRDFDDKHLLVGSSSLETTLPSMLEYCYASFLLGYSTNAHCYFYWHSNAEGGYSVINWFALWESDIGEPLGSYFETDGVYRRDFTNGLVIVNPNDDGEPVVLDLGDEYLDSAGNIVTRITLPNKSAAILREWRWPS